MGLHLKMSQDRSDKEWQTMCEEAEHGKGKWFVVAVTEKGSFVGMLGALEISGKHMRHQVEIVQAYVDPAFRRKKVMEKLFQALATQLRSTGHIEQMIAWVTLHDDQVGKEMFEKLGFTYAGKLSKTVKYEDKYYDCCWLEAPL